MPIKTQKAVSVYVESAELNFMYHVARQGRGTLSWFMLTAALGEAENVTSKNLNWFSRKHAT